jgi:beta-mannosidase
VRPAWRTVDEFVEASQRAQVLGLQIAIEHLRRGKPRTAGVAVWQFDDPWPAVSWSVVDYFGRPKQAYTMLQRVYSPVLASFKYPLKPRRPGDRVLGNLWLVNDWMRTFKGVELRATLKGKRVDTRTCDLAADSSVCIGALEVILEEGDNILRLELRDGQELLSANEYDLNFCDSGEMNPLVRLAAALYSRLMR